MLFFSIYSLQMQMQAQSIKTYFRNNISDKEIIDILNDKIKCHLLGLAMYGGGIPKDHVDYLSSSDIFKSAEIKVCYDIGASLLQWTRVAHRLWNCEVIAFDAVREYEFLYKHYGDKYQIGVLSNEVGRNVPFYQNIVHPGSSSYYKEITTDTHKFISPQNKTTTTLDYLVETFKYPDPDLIKIDVQGAEYDLIMGGMNTIKKCKHLIVELQDVHYNEGAPLAEETIPFIENLGFKLQARKFCDNGPDADYHFVRV